MHLSARVEVGRILVVDDEATMRRLLEKLLKMEGYEVTLALEPADAFGVRDESLVRTIPKSEFPPGVKVGGQLEGRTDDGTPHVFHVMKIKGPVVLLDGNHPLAGKSLRFSLKVTGVRAATAVEIEHKHVHGEHGHHH